MEALNAPAHALWSRLREAYGQALTGELDRSLIHAPDILGQIVAHHPELYAQVGRTYAIHWPQLASWGPRRAHHLDLLERFIHLSPRAGLTHQAALDILLQGAVVRATAKAQDVLQWLLARGADPDAPNPTNQGRTALGQVATQPHAEALTAILIEAGAKVDPLNALGHTPIQEAVMAGHHGHVLALVRAGAVLDRPDPQTRLTARQMIQHRWHQTLEGDQVALVEQARIAPWQPSIRRRGP